MRREHYICELRMATLSVWLYLFITKDLNIIRVDSSRFDIQEDIEAIISPSIDTSTYILLALGPDLRDRS